MCISLLKIPNSTQHTSSFGGMKYNRVPCGKCDACRSRIQNEWYIRTCFEASDCLKKGGKVVYATLTFNDDNLPWLDYEDVLSPCFDYKLIKSFTTAIRRPFSDAGIKDGVRYIITSEYGERTERPHHHAIFCFDPHACALIERVYPSFSLEQPYKDYIQSFWKYGHCRWSKPLSKGGFGIFVSSPSAIKYTCKYVTKDTAFEKSFGVDIENPDDVRQFRHFARRFIPRHYQSRYWGDGVLHNITPSMLVDGVPLPFIQNGKRVLCPVPYYVARKKTHVYLPDSKCWMLSDFGREYRALLHEHLMKLDIDLIQEIHNNSFLIPPTSEYYTQYCLLASRFVSDVFCRFSAHFIALLNQVGDFCFFDNKDFELIHSGYFDSLEKCRTFVHNVFSERLDVCIEKFSLLRQNLPTIGSLFPLAMACVADFREIRSLLAKRNIEALQESESKFRAITGQLLNY